MNLKWEAFKCQNFDLARVLPTNTNWLKSSGIGIKLAPNHLWPDPSSELLLLDNHCI